MRTSYLFAVLSVVLAVSAAPHNSANHVSRFGRRANSNLGGFFGSNNGGNKGGSFGGQGGKNNNGTANGGGKNGGGAAGVNNGTTAGSNGGQDPQTSLTLDSRVIAQGFANDGQDVPTAGQVASLTSTNNFINFCLTVPNLNITNGQQITQGSCNPAPIGVIPSSDNMPSAKFFFPKNGDTVAENTAFTISMNIRNLDTGNFVNADSNYGAAPQQTNQQGQIVGHSHVVIEQLTSIGQTSPTDPRNFAFFKGLNAPAQNGVLTAEVSTGLPAGAYKLSSLNTDANHMPCVVPIAQHGSLDDAVYFTVTANGQAADNNGASGANNSTSAAGGNAGAGNASGAGQSGAGNSTVTGTGTGNATGAGQGGAGNSTVIGAGNAGNSTTSGAGNAGAGQKGSSKGHTGGGQGRQGQRGQTGGRSWPRSRF